MTKNFSLSEFTSKDGAKTPVKVLKKLQILAENLQVLRDEINLPITINSGYRSKAHNAQIGGALSSQHISTRLDSIGSTKRCESGCRPSAA
jgi:uncharacterized protein YcbK (DUF882 family)